MADSWMTPNNDPVDLSGMLSWGAPSSQLDTQNSAFAGLPGFQANPGGGGLFGDMTGGQKIGAGIAGIQTLAGLWNAWQSMKMAKKQFSLTKQMANANLGNQIKTYNNSLEDKITTRAQLQGMSQADANAYLATHSLNKKGT